MTQQADVDRACRVELAAALKLFPHPGMLFGMWITIHKRPSRVAERIPRLFVTSSEGATIDFQEEVQDIERILLGLDIE